MSPGAGSEPRDRHSRARTRPGTSDGFSQIGNRVLALASKLCKKVSFFFVPGQQSEKSSRMKSLDKFYADSFGSGHLMLGHISLRLMETEGRGVEV